MPIYENDLDLSLRHTETASLLGQWLQSASNVDARKIDHFIQGQFGYFGKAAMKLSNINREDGGKSFDITDLGFFKESPGIIHQMFKIYGTMQKDGGLLKTEI